VTPKSSRHQGPSSKEAPIIKVRNLWACNLNIGASNFFGYWSLGFGISGQDKVAGDTSKELDKYVVVRV
jgi:hypothetical protein